jgi:hypothetical protein
MATPIGTANAQYPDSAIGRRLEAQSNIIAAATAVAERLETDEAGKEVLRVKRLFGFAEKSTRGRKPADKTAAATPTAASTDAPKSPTTTGTATTAPATPPSTSRR